MTDIVVASSEEMRERIIWAENPSYPYTTWAGRLASHTEYLLKIINRGETVNKEIISIIRADLQQFNKDIGAIYSGV